MRKPRQRTERSPRSSRAPRAKTTVDFDHMPFRQLVQRDKRLAEIRKSFAGRTVQQRQHAAGWAYDASCARHLFDQALAKAGKGSMFPEPWPPGIEALATDPTYGPALLTVGSMEYQLGRKEEGWALFQKLLKLPKDTADLEELIDKAGLFLADRGNPESALELYEAACLLFPNSTCLLSGLGYCFGKLGRHAEAVAVQRRALAFGPDNPQLLNDLGWALAEGGQYKEAERLLRRAVSIAPNDEWARNTLKEVQRRKRLHLPP